ncbi:phosphotransferase [Guyparkeria hydrothermalis]|uniref:aminoglycoside phosphotransferase family protein n=1 Tax=Guyparkeria hydrothermalis TaxID=923 RepID=UPI0020224F27|nr:phosphotransferase [Guyparkeria hydrothermalis]MCL7744727.1 phosphotransferase [Guyparkeria hydrothermalis]
MPTRDCHPMSDTVADHRRDLARAFLDRHAPGYGSLQAASSDASNRRYWRAEYPDGSTRIVMDSPPEKEPVEPFLDVHGRLEAADLPVPQVHARDLEHGLLLLDDLGSDTLFAWQAQAEPAERAAALADCRAQLVSVARVETSGLPAFDTARLTTEMQLFDEWYRAGHLAADWSPEQQATWQRLRDQIAERLAAMPPVFVHRDYHSRNLMRWSNEWAIIDFQDAVTGPLPYDLVSLLRDSYIDWPSDWVEREIDDFHEQAREAGLTEASREAFVEDFAWVAVQRHLKVLGIFARLSRRDGKHGYLDDLPLTWRHLQWALVRAPELAPLRELIADLEPENAPENARD